jgi:hypothetical protein
MLSAATASAQVYVTPGLRVRYATPIADLAAPAYGYVAPAYVAPAPVYAINQRSPNLSYRIAALFSGRSCARAPSRGARGEKNLRRLDMSEKMISRRGAFSLLGLAAAVGFAVPTNVLMTSDAEAQAQPAAPAPSAPAPSAPATSGMERRHERRVSRTERRHARRTGRMERREARRKGDKIYMKAGETTKQK